MKRFAVVGRPIAHSRSPEIFATLSRESGIALSYERIEIAPDDFARVFAEARGRFDGWNVTAPHKERALANADEVSPNARAVGAANVVSFRDGRASVDNTDVAGVVALLGSRGIDPAGRPATILGAGGAARATALALRDLGASRVVIANRTPERATRLVADLRESMGATELVIGEPEIAPLVINATSDGASVIAAVRTCSAGGWCVDLQYKPADTPFVRAAREAGRNALNGTMMLIAQAIATFRIWYGDVPLDAARVAAELTPIVEAA
jgi:shikimate dehydrogenase